MFMLIKTKYLVIALLCLVAAQSLAAQSESDLLEQLRANYAALIDARGDYEQAVQSGTISSAEKADYGIWLNQVEDQFSDSCRTFSAQSSRAVPMDIPCTEFTASYFKPLDIDIDHETTDGEKTDAITDQFYDSLGEFDEKLLTEQDRVKNQKPRVESENAGAGAAGGGESNGSDSEQGAASEGEGSDESSQGQSQGAETGAGANMPSDGSPGSSSPAGNSNTPDDIPDGSDDDVIARQLREAAEKETDPELQKKLWEEYRRYKSG